MELDVWIPAYRIGFEYQGMFLRTLLFVHVSVNSIISISTARLGPRDPLLYILNEMN